jgi:predicted DNA-binding transcriptional regulator AlpA
MSKQIIITEALVNFDSLPDTSNVRLPVVMGLYGVSAATIWRNVKSGRIPKPRKLTARTTVWNVGDLRSILALMGEVDHGTKP